MLVIICLHGIHTNLAAQPWNSHFNPLNFAKIEAYKLEVSYHKTSHLIFPAPIRYVDLGSESIVAGKAENAENVLRVKAAISDFPETTNFSVITDDGKFYNFAVLYNPNAATFSYDLQKLKQHTIRENNASVLFTELGNHSVALTGLLMDAIHHKNKRNIRHIWTEHYGIRFSVKGMYIHKGLLYLHTELINKSNIPFNTDFISFKIVDKKVAKRTAVQEQTVQPIRIYQSMDTVAEKANAQNVFLFNAFALGDNKMLLIEIFEKNGNRQQLLKVKNADMLYTKPLKDLHLKIE